MVVNQVPMEDEDHLDVMFWLSRSVAERLAEVARLRKNYYYWKEGGFPEQIEKVVQYREL